MRTLWALFLICTLTGCDPEDGWFRIGQPNEGRLTIGLTVAPVDIAEKVILVFHGLEFQSENGQLARFDFDSPLSIDLLTLQNTRERLLDKVDLEAGRYIGIRLLASGDTQGLDSYIIPTGGTQALPLLLPDDILFEIEVDFIMPDRDDLDLTLVFDLFRGLTGSDAQGSFVLRPELRLVNTENTGGIAGTVDERLFRRICRPDGNAVYVFSGTINNINLVDDEPWLSTAVRIPTGDRNGHYALGFLPTGNYTLAFTCQADPNSPFSTDIDFSTPLHTVIETGSVTKANFTR